MTTDLAPGKCALAKQMDQEKGGGLWSSGIRESSRRGKCRKQQLLGLRSAVMLFIVAVVISTFRIINKQMIK